MGVLEPPVPPGVGREVRGRAEEMEGVMLADEGT